MSDHYKTKQVILVRRDLRNAEGHKIKSTKLGIQLAHASMAWIGERFRAAPRTLTDDYVIALSSAESDWLVNKSFAKIVLGVENVDELNALCEKARAFGILALVITDAGHTEFGGVPTVTCAGLGPALSTDVDAITGHLKPL